MRQIHQRDFSKNLSLTEFKFCRLNFPVEQQQKTCYMLVLQKTMPLVFYKRCALKNFM